MRWNALGSTDAAGRTGGTIAAMGKGIEIEAMKPVEIDHVLHAGKMVPGGVIGVAENQGAVA